MTIRSLSAARPVRAALVAAALLVAPGCGGDNGSAPQVVHVGKIDRIGSLPAVTLPFDRIVPSQQDLLALDEAYTKLVTACTRRFGYEYRDDSAPIGQPSLQQSMPFGVSDLKTASQYGYRDPSAPKRPTLETDGTVEPTPELVLSGTGPGDRPTDTDGNPLPAKGCRGEAMHRLHMDADVDAPGLLDGYDPLADKRMRAAAKSWASCMKEQGFDYANPLDPWNQFTAGHPDLLGNISEAERASAVQDVRCKQKTNYLGIALAVTTAYQERALNSFPGLVSERRAWMKQQSDAVAEVLASSG